MRRQPQPPQIGKHPVEALYGRCGGKNRLRVEVTAEEYPLIYCSPD
jgi:hypothetical protein